METLIVCWGCHVDAILIFMHETLLSQVLFKVFKPRSRQPTDDRQPKVKATHCLSVMQCSCSLRADSHSYIQTVLPT